MFVSSKDTQLLCQHYLTILYQNTRGQGVNQRQEKNSAEKYGEILYESMNALLLDLNMNEEDVFYDLGSGLGKVLVQVFLNTKVRECYGIEVIPELHEQAVAIENRLKKELPEFYADERNIIFKLGSFLHIPLHKATVVLIASPCFTFTLLKALGDIINQTSSIHRVLTLRPLTNLSHFYFEKTSRIECSWDTALCYIYKRKKGRASY